MARRLAAVISQEAGIGRNAGPGPFGQGNHQGVLRQFLCEVDVARHAVPDPR